MKFFKPAFLVCGIACGAASPALAENIQVKFWSLKNPGMPEFVEEAIKAFREKRPDVEIVFEDFPNEAYKTAIQVALNGSEPPDVFYNWVGEDSARLVREGLVADISDYGTGPDGFQSILSDGWLSAMEYDGKVYGVPLEAVSKFFYYNTAFFDEHGLSVPSSFDGLLQTCRDIRAIDSEIVPMPLGNSERWKLNHFITMLNERVVGHKAAAADYSLTASDEELFTNPGYEAALQKVLDLQQAQCFQDAPNATAPELTRTMFSTQVSPMIYCGSWCAGIFEGEGFTGFEMFRMPTVEGGAGEDGTNFVLIQGYQISNKSENVEAAVDWLSHLVSPEMALRYAEIMGRIPSNPALLETSDALTPAFKWIAQDVAAVATPINVLDVLLENSVSEAYLDGGVELLNGTKTPAQVMENVRKTALEAKAKR